MFLSSVLQELRGHELQVATDPEVGVVLERLLPSLNDWGRRVIGDSFGEKWETLLTHRFGSHIVQTWMTLAASTLDREVCTSCGEPLPLLTTGSRNLPAATEEAGEEPGRGCAADDG